MTRLAFQNALADILDMPRNALRDSDTRDTLASWTSLADVKILTMISTEFGIEPDAELLNAESIGELMDELERRQTFA
ncbi:MAG TPA: hypothetical protein VFA04_02280 [Bryobacteraceae bacterium]|jgi:acyl carrier protein|nr:hypothetical protein [Bryobacteraceae bacterium]